MLSIEKIIENYEDLMQKNGYTETEILQNTETIRNALAYSSNERLKANALPYNSAKMLYPDIEEWNDIPSSYLDMLLDINVIPVNVSIRKSGKYLICRMENYGKYCSDSFLELDITDDVYECDMDNEGEEQLVDETTLRWRMHCINIRNAVNAVDMKYLKDVFGTLLIDYIGEDEYKSIETKFADAMKLIVWVE